MVRNEIELMIPLKGNRKIWSRFRATVVSIEIYFTWPGVYFLIYLIAGADFSDLKNG